MGKSPQEGDAGHRVLDDSTAELDVLEQTISIEGAKVLRHDTHDLTASPIPQAWILEGTPIARKKLLTCSRDGLALSFMWDCTAGRFNWFYDQDEVIHVLEGSVLLEDAAGVRRQLQAGDTFLLPAGSRFHWTVPDYIRKIAFLYSPLTLDMRIMRKILKGLRTPFRRQPPGPAAWGS
ncbi:MAG TPA: cupin domain-containing protein [Steroidobacteraceae bacterium]|nr:cupin domain-containing protein [Steroidobacteraceae bacterium]